MAQLERINKAVWHGVTSQRVMLRNSEEIPGWAVERGYAWVTSWKQEGWKGGNMTRCSFQIYVSYCGCCCLTRITKLHEYEPRTMNPLYMSSEWALSVTAPSTWHHPYYVPLKPLCIIGYRTRIPATVLFCRIEGVVEHTLSPEWKLHPATHCLWHGHVSVSVRRRILPWSTSLRYVC